METDRTKRNIGARIYIQTLKEKTLMKKPKIKQIELYSSNSNVNINFKKTNFIHLSSLFKTKINKLNQNNSNSCVAGSPKFKSMEKISLKQHKKHYINSLSNYNSLSYKKMSLIKLPKIKNENEINNLVANIFTKFEQVEKNFKEQGKITNFIIKRGDKFLKLKKDYLNDENEKYKYCASKHNYKKQYSNLFRRIQKIHFI